MKRVLCFTAILLAGCASQNELGWSSDAPIITTDSGLIYQVIEAGTGPIAQAGDTVLIHETTRLADGTLIVDTWKLNHPVRFQLGANQVIQGMDEAVAGMRVGERRKLIVPPALSERTMYPDSFGPEDTLYYDVLLVQIEKP